MCPTFNYTPQPQILLLRFVLKKSHLIRERFLNQSNGEMLLALTNTFGYYHFEGIEACQINILEAASKKYQIQHNPHEQIYNLIAGKPHYDSRSLMKPSCLKCLSVVNASEILRSCIMMKITASQSE